MKYSLKHTAIAVALVGAFGVANATPLYFNTVTTTVDNASFFGGTLLNSVVATISTPAYSGTTRTAVYDTGTGLDFYYQFTNNPVPLSQTGVTRFSAFDFSSIGTAAVDVYQTNQAFGDFIVGTEISETADRTTLGVIGFNFVPNTDSKINPGTTSYTQIIRTSARAYQSGNFAIQDGYSTNTPAFAPALPVPEPESFAMLLAGLGLMGTIARRRARTGS